MSDKQATHFNRVKTLTFLNVILYLSFPTAILNIRVKGRPMSYDKKPDAKRKFLKSKDTSQNAATTFNYTKIVDRLRTVSWSNYSDQTDVVTGFSLLIFHSPQQLCS